MQYLAFLNLFIVSLSLGCSTVNPQAIDIYCSQKEKVALFGSKEACVSQKNADNKTIEEGKSPGQIFGKSMGVILQGAGQGLSNASSQRSSSSTVSCTNLGGGQYSCYDYGTARYYNCSQIGNMVNCR